MINSISTIVLDYIDVTQRLQKYLQNASDHRCIKVFRKSISSLDSCVNIKLTKQEDSLLGNDSNLLIVFYVQIMPDDFVMQLHRF
ncbi:hypothetical protein DD585_25500 [Klebsiella pneumoniae]|nr:hypothetical protein DD585_25500 [Klebsiella pneumoniae]